MSQAQPRPRHTPAKASYHHGNLRAALLEQAYASLTASNLESLSLRALAKAVGVSPTAVYGHFADKTALLIELKTLGFAQLSDDMQAALNTLPKHSTPEDRVRELGHTYIRFAARNPSLFELLFFWVPDFERITPACMDEGTRCEGLLRRTLLELFQQHGQAPSEYQAQVASFSTWALVHGISTLLKTGSVEAAIHCKNWPQSFSASQPESQARVIDHLLTVQIEGLKAAARQLSEA